MERRKLTRSQKRVERRTYGLERAKDRTDRILRPLGEGEEHMYLLKSSDNYRRQMKTWLGSRRGVSSLWKIFYHLLHINALRTSPYHPQTDGMVEHFNGTLKEMLRKSAQEDGKDWNKLIPYLLFAYHEAPQESTGFSPFELLYGRDIRGPLDVIKEEWETSPKSDQNVIYHMMMMRERLEGMAILVQENQRKAQRNQEQ